MAPAASGPNEQLPGKARRRPGAASVGGRQPVRATYRRASWSSALCSLPLGHEALLSPWWGWRAVSASSPFEFMCPLGESS